MRTHLLMIAPSRGSSCFWNAPPCADQRPPDPHHGRYRSDEFDNRKKMLRCYPDRYEELHRLSETVSDSGLETSLLSSSRSVCSQLNGCVFLPRHAHQGRGVPAGETEQRLYVLSVWP